MKIKEKAQAQAQAIAEQEATQSNDRLNLCIVILNSS